MSQVSRPPGGCRPGDINGRPREESEMCTFELADAPKDVTPTRRLSSGDPTKRSVVHKSAPQPRFGSSKMRPGKAPKP